MNVSPAMDRAAHVALAVALVTAAVLYPLGLDVDVQDHDEGLYAEIAREMLESGTWRDSPANYAPWFGHPILTMFVMAVGMKLFGVSALAARLPSIPEILLLVGMTYALGRWLFGRAAGAVAAALCVSVPAMSLMGHNVKTDLNLMMGTTTTMLLGMVALQRPWLWIPTGVGAGLGVLAKGPFGLLVPGAVVLAALAWERRWKELARGWPFIILGLGAFAATVVPWNLHMWTTYGMPWLDELYLGSTFRRYGGEQFKGDGTTPLYFFHTLLWAAAPAIPGTLLGLWTRARELRGTVARPPWPTLDLSWVLIPLVVMSMSSMKLPHYIFPVLPALCVLAARGFILWLDGTGAVGPTLDRLARAGSVLLSVVGVLFALAMVVFCFPPAEGFLLLVVFLAGACAVVACLPGMVRGQALPTLVGLCAASSLAVSIHNGAARPELARFSPARMVADVMAAENAPRRGQTTVLTFSEIWRMGIPFLAHVKLVEADLNKVRIDLIDGPGPVWVLGTPEQVKDIQRLGFPTRTYGFGMSYKTSRLSIPFAMVGNREDLATEQLLVRVWRKPGT